jgi:2-haloacid dehalogenase
LSELRIAWVLFDLNGTLLDPSVIAEPLGVLTNSTSETADAALVSAGLRDRFQVVIGSDEVETFKPHPRVYENATARLATEPHEVALVAAHAWDVMGAMRAGLRGAWLARSERWWVPVAPEPDVRGEDLRDVASKLAARAPGSG